MTRLLLCTVAAIGLGAAALSSAKADTITYSQFSELNGQTVHLQDPKINRDISASAGQITLLNTNTAGGSLATWCIDIADWLQSSGSFTSGDFLTGGFGTTVNALLSHVLPTLSFTTDASAALQVAIWRAEYGADLTATATNANVNTLAASYLTNVQNGTWLADPTAAVATLRANGTNQDQAYLVHTPEPAGIAVLGVGLAGLLAIGRSRHRRGAA